MALVGKHTLSYKKTDVSNQRSLAFGMQKIVFAHEATLGDDGITLSGISAPVVMLGAGFVQPSAATLSKARILPNRKNLSLFSSVNGWLVDYGNYTVSTNDRIDFVGFTAASGEIFVGFIDNAPFYGTSVEEFSTRLGRCEQYRVVTSSVTTFGSLDKIAANTTSSALTITLSSTPSVGDTVIIMDAQGTFATNNLTVARNGNTIMGVADNLLLDANDDTCELVYVGGTRGWAVRA